MSSIPLKRAETKDITHLLRGRALPLSGLNLRMVNK